MKTPIMFAWCDALRSGDYIQMVRDGRPVGEGLCSMRIEAGGPIPVGATFSAGGVLVHMLGLEVDHHTSLVIACRAALNQASMTLDAAEERPCRDRSQLADGLRWHEHYNLLTFSQVADMYEHFGVMKRDR